MPWGGLANTTWRWMKRCWRKSRAMAAPISASIAGTRQHSPSDGINRIRSPTFRSCADPLVDTPFGMSTSSHTPPSHLSRCLGHSGKRIVRSTLDWRARCGLLASRRSSLRPIRPSAPPIPRPVSLCRLAVRSSSEGGNSSDQHRFDGATRSSSTDQSFWLARRKRSAPAAVKRLSARYLEEP